MAAAPELPVARTRDRIALHPWVLALKKLAAVLLCHPWVGAAIGRIYGNLVPSGGLVVETPPGSVGRRTVAQLYWGIYEGAERRLLERHLNRELDVVELGSSLGVVSSVIARLQAPDRRLVCVEANPDLVDVIRRNLDRNAPGRAVEIVSGAIAYDAPGGVVELRLADSHTGASILRPADARAGVVRVPALTVSRLLAEHGIGDYALVCDIEGAEVQLLRRDAGALARCRQVLIELHETRDSDAPVHVEDLRRELTDVLGFRTVTSYGNVSVFERP